MPSPVMPSPDSTKKGCLRDKCCCLQGCAAGTCCTIGIIAFIAGPMIFGGIREGLIEDTVDLMFIDDTIDTTPGKIIGDMASEKKQFEQWKMSTKEAFKKCAKENSAKDCINGMDVDLAIFNVTNPLGVINGEKPILQELGPIFMKSHANKTNIDEEIWNKDGVAKFQQIASFELDEEKCDQACKDLLQAKVVVPNPVFASTVALGAEVAFGAIVAVGATAQMLPAGSDIGAVFGITNATQSAAFAQVFLTPDLMGAGGFLMTAQTAAVGLQQTPPDMSGTCVLGTLILDALTCGTVFQKLMESVPTAWTGTMGTLAPAYGTGLATPVFIEITVAQVLGFGATFTDPLSQTPDLSFGVAVNGVSKSDPPGVFRESQMAKKYREKGANYNVKYGGMAQDCRWDLDCTLSTPMPDSCTASDACTPNVYEAFHGTGLPGKLWGEPAGFDSLKKGTKFAMFDTGMIYYTVTSEEKSESIKTGDHAGAELKYFQQSFVGFHERNENCGGEGPGSPGIDCSGPKHTLNVGPASSGAPFYFSPLYFDTEDQLTNDPSQKDFKYGPNSYDPADKVVITKCKGHKWCTEKDYKTYLKFESATGLCFEMKAGAQMNVRIGSTPSMFYPMIADATIPVWGAIATLSAPDKLLGDLYGLQSFPERLEAMIAMSMIIGAVCLVVGLLCCGIIFYRQNQYSKNEKNEKNGVKEIALK